ncbi:MAG: hypothetical protein NUW37_17480 [Planctomycetes bacterium]|nr:hypothetical protein [Planctomycetota bacterium]
MCVLKKVYRFKNYYVWDGANRQSVHDENGDAINVSVYGPQLAPGIGGLEYTLDATGAPDSLEPVHLEDQVGTGGLIFAALRAIYATG